MSRIKIIFILSLFVFKVHAQVYSIIGTLVDKSDHTPAGFVYVVATNENAHPMYATTDIDGKFALSGLQPGKYALKISYLGYKDWTRTITIANSTINLGQIFLEPAVKELKEVKIDAQAIRVQQKGDTSQYNADAFKVHQDANAEELVTKMPGITMENGTVKAHGENVQKVTVDGKEFFGDDATLALKNLPSEIIDKIQIYDRLSDQAQFTGFDDGSSVKAMNIVTRKNKNAGEFGKAYAGYGTDSRYNLGGNLNFFNGKRRITLLGLANNTNQQNFASQDLLGVTGTNTGGSRGGGSRNGSSSGGTSQGSNNGGTNNFLVNQMSGIAKTRSGGINYSDSWGSKINFTGSYFFNAADNISSTQTERNYFGNAGQGKVYKELNTSTSKNTNHRLNARLEYNIDSSNAIIFQPRLGFQSNSVGSFLDASNFFHTELINNTHTDRDQHSDGYNFSGTTLYRHKFKTSGRTISLNLQTDLSNKEVRGNMNGTNIFSVVSDSLLVFDQRSTQLGKGYIVGGTLAYTEPISKSVQLQLNYAPSRNYSSANKTTLNINPVTSEYNRIDTGLTNFFKSELNTQASGINFRKRGEHFNFTLGVNYQHTNFLGKEVFPGLFVISRKYDAILPVITYNYRFGPSIRLRMSYRASANSPSISQLQNVIDNSNPLLLNSGNSGLQQDYSHTVIIRYGSTNTDKTNSLFAFLYVTKTEHYIGNSTFLAGHDTLLPQNVLLKKGSQFSQPVNLNGYYSLRSFIGYGIPVSWLKCNFNLNGGLNYTRQPGLINGHNNFSSAFTYMGGAVLSSNVSERVDFTISYNSSYNQVFNTLKSSLNNRYYTHTATAKLNLVIGKGFILNTDIGQTFYQGLSSGYNQNYFLWNVYIGKKFLKDQSLEARCMVYDILKQNANIARNNTDIYAEDVKTNVMQQYFMFTIIYSIRNFKNNSEKK